MVPPIQPTKSVACGVTHMQKPLKLLKLSDVTERTGLGRSMIYDMAAAGQFPKPVRIGGASRWIEHEVEAALAAFIANRDAPAPRGAAARAKASARRAAPSARAA